MVLEDLILLITGIIAVYKNDIKKIHNNKTMIETNILIIIFRFR